jgi:tetratricopeptide (TPR) repeat protein
VVFWRLGKYQEAIKAVRLASDLDPDKMFYRGLLQRLLLAEGLLEEAKLEDVSAKRMDRYDLDLLGRTLTEMGFQP